MPMMPGGIHCTFAHSMPHGHATWRSLDGGSRLQTAPLSARLSDLASVLWSALRHQSIENAPMAVFATVGVLLTLFMLRS